MKYVYCKSHLGVHRVDDDGSTQGRCSVIDKGKAGFNYEHLDASSLEQARQEARNQGWLMYIDRG